MRPLEPFSASRAEAIIVSEMAREGPMLPILHGMMEAFGCVPEAAVPIIAEKLNLTRAEVHGVVTFYHDFRREPAGRHVIKLCRAEACQAVGCETLADHVQETLGIGFGDTTTDGSITLEAVYCLGLCAQAPAALIDDRVVGRLTAEKLDRTIGGLT